MPALIAKDLPARRAAKLRKPMQKNAHPLLDLLPRARSVTCPLPKRPT